MSLPPDVSRSASAAEPAAQPAPTSRRRWLYGAVAGAAALGGAGLAWWAFKAQAREEGGEAVLIPGDLLRQVGDDDDALVLDPHRAAGLAMKALQGRPVLLNFWATWCPPCVEELPMLNAFYRENASKGWQVVGLAIDQPSSVRKFLDRLPLDFPVGLAGLGGTELGRSLGNLTGGLPFTVVLGQGGRVLHRKMGQVTPDDLQQWVNLR